MTPFPRRRVLTGLAAALSGSVLPSWGQTAKPAATSKPKPANKLAAKLRIVIPANPGGGWDQTGRALGTAMISAGVVDEIEYENKGGKGGTIGLTYYAEKYSADPNTVIMGGTVMLGAVALQKPAVDMSSLAPLSRLTSDYLVMVVAANSPIRSASDLSAAMKANLKNVPIAGGSAGGVDHIFSGVFARAAGANPEDLVYQPFAGRPAGTGRKMGGTFYGRKQSSNKAKPFWGWHDNATRKKNINNTGQWGLDPAYAVGKNVTFPAGEEPSTTYTFNPYLGIE